MIEQQRTRLDLLVSREKDLTKLLPEGQKMDRLVEAYEDTYTI
jgi:hypothetical protein